MAGLPAGARAGKLRGHAVLRCPGEGRYFLDLANWQRLRVIALAVIAGLLVLLALILLLTARQAG